MDEAETQPADGNSEKARQDALASLQWNWGEAYEIEIVRDVWRAMRLDGLGGWITTGDPDELAQKISDDYGVKRVPRDAARGLR